MEDGRPLETSVVTADFGVNYVSCTVACGSGHGALWGGQLGWSGSGALWSDLLGWSDDGARVGQDILVGWASR